MNEPIEQLLGAICEGVATDGQLQRLETMLEEPRNVRLYARYLLLDADLRWECAGGLVQSFGTGGAVDVRSGWMGNRRTLFRNAMALAAMLVMVTGLAVLMYSTPAKKDSPAAAPQAMMAVLVDAQGAVWGEGSIADAHTLAGAQLPAGTLRLEGGSAELLFNDGAVVTLNGPGTFQVTGPNSGRLSFGRLAAYVPERARGFEVQAPGHTVRDLGTKFALHCDGAGTEVQVQDGRIQIFPHGENHRPVELLAGEARRLFADGRIATLEYEPSRFKWMHGHTPGVAAIEGDVEMLSEAPSDVSVEALASDRAIRLMLERTSVKLPRPIAADLVESGFYNDLERPGKPRMIDAGLRVRTYLLHLDAVGEDTSLVREGSVTFDEPIVGVITWKDRLFATDRLLGAPDTAYPNRKDTLDRDLDLSDEVTISEDRRTLTMKLLTERSIDQMRVLVMHPQEASKHPAE